MNVIGTQAISPHAPGTVLWTAVGAAAVGGGFHNVGELLVLLALVGVGFAGVARAPRAAVSFERPAGGWAVEAHGLTKRFGANVAVDGVELSVPRGSAFGYLGPNGAGKTTLMRTLLGLTQADGGTMSLVGMPVPANRDRALARVGAIVDEPRFHPHLTGRREPAPAGRRTRRRQRDADRAVTGQGRPCGPRR
jgi:hypothetical protein